jgi:predicted molibdopterin-dependent oxidoreductase YjgC
MTNLAMATGNIGKRGVGVNPLLGQNNVQVVCDMGSFPHENYIAVTPLFNHGFTGANG